MVKKKQTDLKQFYTSIVIPICEYAAPVWAISLTLLQWPQIIQKRAILTIFLFDNYSDVLSKLNFDTLEDRRDKLCKGFFFNIIKREINKIHETLPKKWKYDFEKAKPYLDTEMLYQAIPKLFCAIRH